MKSPRKACCSQQPYMLELDGVKLCRKLKAAFAKSKSSGCKQHPFINIAEEGRSCLPRNGLGV